MLLKVTLIAAGGALGSVLRYAVQLIAQRLVGGVFPFGTLIVNVVGCFVIGIVAGAVSAHAPIREEYRLGIMVGILGGFTTFSSFGLETFGLASGGRHWLASANVIGSCAACLIAVAIGFRLGSQWG